MKRCLRVVALAWIPKGAKLTNKNASVGAKTFENSRLCSIGLVIARQE